MQLMSFLKNYLNNLTTSLPTSLPTLVHGHCPTYLFFFSFFVFLFSLRLFCGAFLLSFIPLLFSFIIPSSLEPFYVLVFPSYGKKQTTVPFFVLGLFQ